MVIMFGHHSVLCFCILEIILLGIYTVLSQKEPDVMERLIRRNAAGFGDDFKIKNCSFTNCTFVFLCPYGFELEYNNYTCVSRHKVCPSIATLNYTVYPYNRIIDEPDKNISKFNISDNRTKTCRYNVDDFTLQGDQVGDFKITFDFADNTLTLNVSVVVDEKYIKCYADHKYLHIHKITDLHDDYEETFSYYNMDIDREPREYYCYVDAPSIFQPKVTQRVIAYTTSTLYIKYILKVTTSNFDVVSLRDVYCKANNLDSCKLIKMDVDAWYYFFQLSSYAKLIPELIEEIVRNVSSTDSKIEYLRNVDYCEAEITNSSKKILHWERSLVGTVVTPRELCFDKYGRQLTRRCIGNFLKGAHWEVLPASECSDFEGSSRTRRLHGFITGRSMNTTFSNITVETNDFTEFTPIDVNLLSLAFESVPIQEDDFFQSIENTMRIDHKRLRDSQNRYNSTDRILDAVDSYSMKMARETEEVSYTVKSNLVMQVTYPLVSKVFGLVLYSDGSNNFSNYKIANLYENETFDNINLVNLELAMYIPKELIQNLLYNSSTQDQENFKVINTIFYNDSLFNEGGNIRRPTGSRIINVNIPGYEGALNGSIPLLFKRTLSTNNTGCVFWNYGRQKSGRWSRKGGNTSSYYESLVECSFTHLTHFALLVLSEDFFIVDSTDDVLKVKDAMDPHDTPLTVITVIGCSLSVIGIVGILVTVISFKGWYKRRLNSIQLSIIMLLEVIILFVADLDDLKRDTTCQIIAITLHYVVLAKLTWMLLIARIQYLKFVKVLQLVQINSYTTFYNLLGWILPAIPVAVSYLVFPKNYVPGFSNFCYVKEDSLYFFLIFPATLIILLNIAVFAMIMYNISNSKCQDYGTSIYKLQIRLAIMLFFMLGVTWIFGIIGEILPFNWVKLTCIYLFCILGSIQGFVLFIFNVFLDIDTRCFWKDSFKSLQCKKVHRKK